MNSVDNQNDYDDGSDGASTDGRSRGGARANVGG
jgi:hypothetical protein